MDEKHFEELWEQEERQGLQRRLQQEYPAWQQRRRVRRTALASVAVVLVAGFSFFNFQFSTPKSYDSVACNRSGIAEGHWAAEASRILTIETL
ncbi:MAG: hypothetical protein IKN29_00355 [Bacteroidales bacterium]|nr:hypothetical protein [Bacteroidales bacterium]